MMKEKKEKKKEKKREKSLFREYFELIAETAIFVFFVMTFVVQAFQIPTGSMVPTLLVGDFLLVNKLVYSNNSSSVEDKVMPHKELERYDIVVFKYPKELSKDFVKRVIALEGEKIQIKDRQVYINDKPIPEEYKVHKDDNGSRNDYFRYNNDINSNFGPVVVPPGHCFVMGDNRDNSMDSRYWSFLPLSHIKGKPWIIYFSYKAEKGAYLKTSFRERMKKIISFVPKARWKRFFHIIK